MSIDAPLLGREPCKTTSVPPSTLVAEDLGIRWLNVRSGSTVALHVPGESSIHGKALLPGDRWIYLTLRARPIDPPSIGPPCEHFCRTTSGGAFAFEHLAPGRYTIDVEDGDFEENDQEFEASLAPGTTLDAGDDSVQLPLRIRRVAGGR